MDGGLLFSSANGSARILKTAMMRILRWEAATTIILREETATMTRILSWKTAMNRNDSKRRVVVSVESMAIWTVCREIAFSFFMKSRERSAHLFATKSDERWFP
jgi:hypothetical protein